MEGEDAQTKDLNSDQKATMKTVSAFRRRAPLAFSPKRQYGVAVVSPMQRRDSSEPVIADVASLGTSSPDHSSSRFEEAIAGIQRRYREGRHASVRSKPLTLFKPFSFDKRDAAQRVQRERRLRESRQVQHQWLKWISTFKARPIRRYKPMVQPPTHFKDTPYRDLIPEQERGHIGDDLPKYVIVWDNVSSNGPTSAGNGLRPTTGC